MIKRPLTVWLAQFLLALQFLLFLAGYALFTLVVVGLTMPNLAATQMILSPVCIMFFTTTLVATIPLEIIVILAFWGLQTRKVYGRWLSISWLTLTLVALIQYQTRTLQSATSINLSYITDLRIGFLILDAFVLIVVLYLAFGDQEKAYFRSKKGQGASRVHSSMMS